MDETAGASSNIYGSRVQQSRNGDLTHLDENASTHVSDIMDSIRSQCSSEVIHTIHGLALLDLASEPSGYVFAHGICRRVRRLRAPTLGGRSSLKALSRRSRNDSDSLWLRR